MYRTFTNPFDKPSRGTYWFFGLLIVGCLLGFALLLGGKPLTGVISNIIARIGW